MGLRAASKMDVKQGTAGDAWSSAIEYDFQTWILSFECWNESLDVQLSYDGIEYQDAIKIDPDRPLVIPFAARSEKVKNTESGKDSEYQTVGVV